MKHHHLKPKNSSNSNFTTCPSKFPGSVFALSISVYIRPELCADSGQLDIPQCSSPWPVWAAICCRSSQGPAYCESTANFLNLIVALLLLLLIWFIACPLQADLNSSGMQDGPGSFYGVSSQYSSHENMTITVSTKVCSFGKQVVEKVEVRTAELAFVHQTYAVQHLH